MSLESDLAHRFLRREPTSEHPHPGVRPVVRVSAIGVALGVMLILLSFFIIDGFKREIRSTIDGFVGTIKISNPDNTYNRYSIPLEASPELIADLTKIARAQDPAATVYTFADEMTLVRTDSVSRAVAVHGVDSLYDAHFMAQYLRAGELPTFSGEATDEVLLSTRLARLFRLEVGDRFLCYFTDGESFRVRRLMVKGLYETGFEEYDRSLMIADIRLVRGILGFSEDEVGGIDIHLADHAGGAALFDRCFDYLAERNARLGERYTMFTSEELYPGIFSWLSLLDANVYMILGLMIIVAAITMITGIVVLVLEKVRAIALLKTLGQTDRSLRRLFVRVAGEILWRGLLGGNALALLLAGIQSVWHPLRLDPSQYYISYVPIAIRWETLLLVNLIVLVCILLLVLIPTRIIARIHPAEALRFE